VLGLLAENSADACDVSERDLVNTDVRANERPKPLIPARMRTRKRAAA
jgi:hypothetical protein